MEKKKLFAPVWKHWKHAFHHYRGLVIVTTIAYALATLFGEVLRPIWLRGVLDALTAHTDPLHFLYLIIMAGVLTWICNRTADYCLARSESRIIKYLKDYALARLLRHSTHFFFNTFPGSIVAKAKRFAGTTEGVFDEFSFTILRILILLPGAFYVIYSTLPAAGFILIGWAVLFGAVTWYLSRLRTPYDLRSADADSHTTGHMSDIIGSVHMIHSYTAEDREYSDFRITTEEEHQHRFKAWIRGNAQWALQGVLVLLLEILSLYTVITYAMHGLVTLGTVVLVQSYVVSVSGYMWAFGRSVTKIRNAFADAHDMATMLTHEEGQRVPHQTVPVPYTYAIEFKDVTFSYPSEHGNPMSIFQNFSLCLEEGKRYGFVGVTGSGKTTMTRLLLRQFNVSENAGTITIGGIDIKDMSQEDLRQLISYVPQDPQFPFRKLRDLIAFGKPNATLDEIMEAAEKASCHSFIQTQMEDGYETKAGERGVKLSGGQRQRIAIAAAFLKNAPILILDEPTSALDAETENSIQAILRDMRDKTMIVIAHRLTTVAKLDEIIVLKDGNVYERGTHDQLLKHNGMYRSLWDMQYSFQEVS